MAPPTDVLIIGGGPAGLMAALALARQLQSSIIFDNNDYRNKPSEDMHLFLTQDHANPSEFREKSKENILSRYDTISCETCTITNARQTEDGSFEVEDDGGRKWQGKKLVLATGVQDIFPEIDGYAECWTKGMYVYVFMLHWLDSDTQQLSLLFLQRL